MQGRLENKKKNEKNIENILKELPDCVEQYYLSRPNKESKGSLEYIRKIRNFLKYVNEDTSQIDVTEITEIDISKYLRSIEKTIDKNGNEIETSFAYRKQVYTILNSFFCYLKKKRIINENPMEYIDRPDSVDKIKRIKLDEYDLKCILEAVDEGAGNDNAKHRQEKWKERDRAIITLFVHTGIRETALTEINVDDVDFLHDTITVVDKRHKTHVYVMSNAVRDTLSAWIDKRNELIGENQVDALFISGKKTNGVYNRIASGSVALLVRKYSEEGLGYVVSPHKLRSAFCTLLYRETHDIKKVCDAVGHSNVSTTQRYIVDNDSAKRESAAIMNTVFG